MPRTASGSFLDHGALRHDLPRALRIVWLIVAAVGGLAAIAPFLFSDSFLFGVFPVCAAKTAGSECILCGMTTAFVRIGAGDVAGAQAANGGALTVYFGLVLNFAAAAAYTMMRVIRHANH